MNNLHRELAPVSDAAWAQIEEEASRTLKRHLAARRVVDVVGPKGVDFSAVGTGHLLPVAEPGDGIRAAQREVKALVELRVPFELCREAIDDVERGADRFRTGIPSRRRRAGWPSPRTAPSSTATPLRGSAASARAAATLP